MWSKSYASSLPYHKFKLWKKFHFMASGCNLKKIIFKRFFFAEILTHKKHISTSSLRSLVGEVYEPQIYEVNNLCAKQTTCMAQKITIFWWRRGTTPWEMIFISFVFYRTILRKTFLQIQGRVFFNRLTCPAFSCFEWSSKISTQRQNLPFRCSFPLL